MWPFDLLVVRALLAWILISAASEKAWRPHTMGNIVTEWLQWSANWANRVTRLLAAIELILGIGLLFPIYWPLCAALACALLTSFSLVLAHWTRSRLVGDCGCGGLLPMRQITVGHAGLVATLAVIAGTIAITGFMGEGVRSPSGQLLPMQLLMLFSPLPALLSAAAIYALIENGARLKWLDHYHSGAT